MTPPTIKPGPVILVGYDNFYVGDGAWIRRAVEFVGPFDNEHDAGRWERSNCDLVRRARHCKLTWEKKYPKDPEVELAR